MAATILNISEDHMDRYDSMADYIKAKFEIYQGASQLIANSDDEATWPTDLSNTQFFGSKKGDYHLSLSQAGLGDELALMYKNTSLMPVSEMAMTGRHNQLNALAALALAKAAGIEQSACLETLRQYSGMAHRCELVSDKLGMTWVNDSKATNVGATIAALQGLAANVEGRLHLIVGGDGKGADFSLLAAEFDAYVAELYCMGKDAKAIAQLKNGAHLVKNLEQAVNECVKNGESGDWILLSPACASLDMYKNFMARGEHFKDLVAAL